MAKKIKSEDPLVAALKFAALAQDEKSTDLTARHCRFIQGYVVGFDRVLAAGAPAPQVQATICPNTFRLIDALERVKGQKEGITVEANRIIVASERFTAKVEAVQPDQILYVSPEQGLYPIDDRFRTAGKIASMYTREGSDEILTSSVFSQDGALIGTNRFALVQAYFAGRFPAGLVIPKRFFDMLNKINKRITHFGYYQGGSGLTIWFEDQSFIRTQLYSMENIPDFNRFIEHILQSSMVEIPKGFWEGVNDVSSFSEDRKLSISQQQMRVTNDEAVSTQKHVPDMSGQVNIDLLKVIEPHAQKIDVNCKREYITWTGANERGIICKIVPRDRPVAPQPQTPTSNDPFANVAITDKDIRF